MEEELEKQMLDSGSWELKIRGKSLTSLGISERVSISEGTLGLWHIQRQKKGSWSHCHWKLLALCGHCLCKLQRRIWWWVWDYCWSTGAGELEVEVRRVRTSWNLLTPLQLCLTTSNQLWPHSTMSAASFHLPNLAQTHLWPTLPQNHTGKEILRNLIPCIKSGR